MDLSREEERMANVNVWEWSVVGTRRQPIRGHEVVLRRAGEEIAFRVGDEDARKLNVELERGRDAAQISNPILQGLLGGGAYPVSVALPRGDEQVERLEMSLRVSDDTPPFKILPDVLNAVLIIYKYGPEPTRETGGLVNAFCASRMREVRE